MVALGLKRGASISSILKGLDPSTLSRILANFEKSGLIHQDQKTIELLDIRALH